MATECQICAESFNRSTRAPISCESSNCNFEACKTCVRTYLLNTSKDPHCMSCRNAWSQNYLVMKLNRSFITNDFKKHRKNLLLEQQLSRLPATMEAADRVRRSEVEQAKADEIRTKIYDLKTELRKAEYDYRKHYNEANRIKNGTEKEGEKKQFIMPCSNKDCRGFLSTQWKCDICEKHSCSKCFEIIGNNKNDPHECKDENIKSAELIRKECRQCPGKCGANIFKTEGCDQMFCTQCHVAFSWKTGEIEKGPVHNPHWYQWQATLNNGTATRAPGDVLCGGLITYSELRNFIINKITPNGLEKYNKKYNINKPYGVGAVMIFRDYITELHRIVQEINHWWLRDARQRVQDLENGEPMRIEYILGRKSKEEVAKNAYKNDSSRRKYAELLNVYELLGVVGIEIFAAMVNSKNQDDVFIGEVYTHLASYNELRQYCNKQLAQISISYNQRVPQINTEWKVERLKAKLSKAELFETT